MRPEKEMSDGKRQVSSGNLVAGGAETWYTAIPTEIPTDLGWRLMS